ncbi:MAG TPA: glucose-6-phosphate dehydrogenase assembly protein OpcA [Candidatus Limnocylindrales bacterium]
MAKDLTTSRPVAHSLAEIEGQLGKLWARAAAAQAAAAKAEAAVVAAQAEAAARAAASLAASLTAAHEAGSEVGNHVVARTSVLNLVVLAGDEGTAERCAAIIASAASRHASRSLILSAVNPDGEPGLEASVEALALTTAVGRTETGAETIYIRACGETGRHLASIIVPLLVHDLPVALWWPNDPPFDSHRAGRLLPLADRLIVDGSAWSGSGLDILAQLAVAAERFDLVPIDWSMLRQSRWREAVASVYDLPDLRPHLGAVRRIDVEYSTDDPGDQAGNTNVVRPLYHVAWLASRLGMTVRDSLRREPDGRRVATLRQRNHQVSVVLKPADSKLPAGSTVRVVITSQVRGTDLVGEVTAGDRDVEVTVRDGGRVRLKRTYLAPRLNDVDLLSLSVEENAADPVSVQALAMVHRLLGVESGPQRSADERKGEDDD